MIVRSVFLAAVLSLVMTGARAQTAEPAKAPPAAEQAKTPAAAANPAPETPTDSRAFRDATRITDPQKKIEALEKFKKDFPNSTMVPSASMNIFTTLAQKIDRKSVV